MSYQVVCTEQKVPTYHNHIVGVGTGTATNIEYRWSVEEVRTAILNGTRFYTVSPSTGRVANVERFDCGCGYKTIRSTPDAIRDNNLDNLAVCPWPVG